MELLVAVVLLVLVRPFQTLQLLAVEDFGVEVQVHLVVLVLEQEELIILELQMVALVLQVKVHQEAQV